MKTREAGLLRKDFLLAAWGLFPSCLHGALSFSLPSEAVYSVDMGLAVNWMPLPTFAKADLPTWQCYAVWTFFAAWGMSPSTAAAPISVGWPDRGSSRKPITNLVSLELLFKKRTDADRNPFHLNPRAGPKSFSLGWDSCSKSVQLIGCEQKQ